MKLAFQIYHDAPSERVRKEENMRILSIKAENLPLLKEPLNVTFYAQQRVTTDDQRSLHLLFSNIYQSSVIGFIGMNASGKTTVLRVIDFALNLLSNEPINHIETRDILGKAENAVFDILFYNNAMQVERLVTIITASKTNRVGEERYRILEETLYRKTAKSIKTRKGLKDYSSGWDIVKRDHREDYLPDDVSIIIAENRRTQEQLTEKNLFQLTDINILENTDQIPEEIIQFFDPSIEVLRFEHDKDQGISSIHLKFRESEEILLNNIKELNHYLSSGTIKGITTFIDAIEILKDGGYLLVDEIENHFNKEIVATLVRFFMDSDLNKNGGTLIFSTHYPEILDEFSRNDSIYITRNRNGITAENLSCILKRNDIKKSEAYESGYLEGTVPMYDAYLTLKKQIKRILMEDA